jgi:hypothetical protein
MEEQVIRSPGRITIELTRPKKTTPLWRQLLRIGVIYFIVVGGLKLLSLLFG